MIEQLSTVSITEEDNELFGMGDLKRSNYFSFPWVEDKYDLIFLFEERIMKVWNKEGEDRRKNRRITVFIYLNCDRKYVYVNNVIFYNEDN